MILTLANLLSRGYFPGELPPPFTTTRFAKAVTAPGVSLPIDFTKRKNAWCDFTSYSLARPGSLRHRLAIAPRKIRSARWLALRTAKCFLLKICDLTQFYSRERPEAQGE